MRYHSKAMHILTVVDEDASPLYSMKIPPINPMLAVPAILKALSELPELPPIGQKRRKPRKDKGKPRNVTEMPETAA